MKFDVSSNFELSEEWGSLVPNNTRFYWKMLPPKRSIFGGYTGGASELKRMSGYGPAPRLAPVTAAGSSPETIFNNTQNGPSTHVNVRDEHHWTESPISSRREVPVLNLKELQILSNPMLNQIANNVQATVGSGAEGVEKVKRVFNEVSGEGFSFDKKAKEISTAFNETINSTTALQEESFADPMNPYQLLYTVMPTGFKYSLPYMENTYSQVTGTFGSDPSSGQGKWTQAVAKLAEAGNELLQGLNTNRLLAPGRLIEKPKAFTFTGREKSYTVSFPLLNTKSYVEIIKNWQYLFLLSYQNTPNRVNRDLIDPPCIYEAYIPGVWYSKYASITDMRVDFLGARREMEVPIMFLDSADQRVGSPSETNWLLDKKKLVTVIPDAYQVTITVTELFSETQNSKYQMLRESMNDKVRTGTT